MSQMPNIVSEAWDKKVGPVIFTTVSREGIPNSIYATCVSRYDGETLVVAHNYFSKTLQNIIDGSSGSILFITEDASAYQVKGSITLHTEGPIFDDMKGWNPEKHPGHAAAALHVESVYSGSKQLL